MKPVSLLSCPPFIEEGIDNKEEKMMKTMETHNRIKKEMELKEEEGDEVDPGITVPGSQQGLPDRG